MSSCASCHQQGTAQSDEDEDEDEDEVDERDHFASIVGTSKWLNANHLKTAP